MNVLSLFSGIGGIDYGLECAGMTTVGQVEIDAWCVAELEKHWPEVPRHDDVHTCIEWWGAEPRPTVDLISGGFPCQPTSNAGQRLGRDDERWLWPAMAAVVRALRPDWVFVENVPGLLVRGMGDVLGDLASCGYDAEWDCIPASAVGAPHQRDRVWIVAYPDTERRERGPRIFQAPGARGRLPVERGDSWWAAEPSMGRVAHGIPARVDRIQRLGNAAVPQVAEHVGRLILDADAEVLA